MEISCTLTNCRKMDIIHGNLGLYNIGFNLHRSRYARPADDMGHHWFSFQFDRAPTRPASPTSTPLRASAVLPPSSDLEEAEETRLMITSLYDVIFICVVGEYIAKCFLKDISTREVFDPDTIVFPKTFNNRSDKLSSIKRGSLLSMTVEYAAKVVAANIDEGYDGYIINLNRIITAITTVIGRDKKVKFEYDRTFRDDVLSEKFIPKSFKDPLYDRYSPVIRIEGVTRKCKNELESIGALCVVSLMQSVPKISRARYNPDEIVETPIHSLEDWWRFLMAMDEKNNAGESISTLDNPIRGKYLKIADTVMMIYKLVNIITENEIPESNLDEILRIALAKIFHTIQLKDDGYAKFRPVQTYEQELLACFCAQTRFDTFLSDICRTEAEKQNVMHVVSEMNFSVTFKRFFANRLQSDFEYSEDNIYTKIVNNYCSPRRKGVIPYVLVDQNIIVGNLVRSSFSLALLKFLDHTDASMFNKSISYEAKCFYCTISAMYPGYLAKTVVVEEEYEDDVNHHINVRTVLKTIDMRLYAGGLVMGDQLFTKRYTRLLLEPNHHLLDSIWNPGEQMKVYVTEVFFPCIGVCFVGMALLKNESCPLLEVINPCVIKEPPEKIEFTVKYEVRDGCGIVSNGTIDSYVLWNGKYTMRVKNLLSGLSVSKRHCIRL